MAKPKSKKCQGKKCGGKRQPIDNFPNSPHTDDGKLNYCRECWSSIMKKARAKGKARKEAALAQGDPPKKKVGRPRRNALEVANEALLLANNQKERFLVQAINGKKKVELKEFKNEQKALKYAMEWKLKGSTVRIWREVEFQMVLRIIG